MSRDSQPQHVITRTLDDQHEMDILNDRAEYQRAKFFFWPIVIGFTIFMGLFAGIQGAVMGFFFGLLAGGVFLLRGWMWMKDSENKYRARLSIREEFRGRR